jgi:hypothetical protein
MPRKPHLLRQARLIKVSGGEEVYTRLSKQEYERRREAFEDNAPDHLASFYYDEWVEMGAQGGRPKKWKNEAERKKTERAIKKAQAKLAQGQPLTLQERELLGLIKARKGAQKDPTPGRMNPAERKRASRANKKALGL